MIQLVQTEEKDYARDVSSRALINTNRSALAEHRQRKEQAARLEKLEKDVEHLMLAVQDIREAIKDLGIGK